MSTSTVRRVKERGGGGGKVAAAGKISPVSGKSVPTGKENPRPTSRVRAATHKPNTRPVARIDKLAAAEGVEEPRPRWSTTSVPRGRSSSPSEFTRVLSDLRKSSSGVSLGPPQRKVNGVSLKRLNEKSAEKSDLGKRVLKDLVKNGEILCELEQGLQEKATAKTRNLNNGSNKIKEGKLSSVSLEKQHLEKNEGNLALKTDFQENEKIKIMEERNLSSISLKRSNLEVSRERSTLEFDLRDNKVSEEVQMNSCPAEVLLGPILRDSKMLNNVSNFSGVVREDTVNKYPSKLYEKLAFLEGKVKRIMSDIKSTKEILDTNNPDASKIILSDIQQKISGIEKAMVHVVGKNGDAKMVVVKSEENQDKKEEKEFKDAKSLAKGLNVEELETRVFPHHKLMRDRTLSKTTSGGSKVHVLEVEESNNALNVDKEKVSSLDENAITWEFLASLSKEVSETSKIQEMDHAVNSVAESSSLNALNDKFNVDAFLMADEKLDEFDDQERPSSMICEEEIEENCTNNLNDIGRKTSTGGWFVSEGESVLLAHDDGSCSFYDIVNCEEKAEYKPPAGVSPNMWRDCWIVRAPNAEGCSGRYVVAASAGNSENSGFCSWDFHTKGIRAFHFENGPTYVRTNNIMHGQNVSSTYRTTENRQWWYKPCGPLIISGASCQKLVQIYDIRDGEHVMKWESQKPVLGMDYASPLQWRNKGNVVIAESDKISLWDVSSLSSRALLSVPSSGRKISALHVNNTDAELGGGVRQRISSSEAEGNDGVFSTPDSIHLLDFRHPSGIGLKIPKVGVDVQSIFSCGDSIYVGCSSLMSTGKKQYSSQIQQFSLRKQGIFSTYTLPESNASNSFTALIQVWGNSNLVMGVCGLGLFVFDSLKDYGQPSLSMDYGSTQNVKDVIGPDNMCCPSFDYLASRVLLISRDRPAQWRYLL